MAIETITKNRRGLLQGASPVCAISLPPLRHGARQAAGSLRENLPAAPDYEGEGREGKGEGREGREGEDGDSSTRRGYESRLTVVVYLRSG